MPEDGKSGPGRTFHDRNVPKPGYLELALVVHWDRVESESSIHSLVATGASAGWTAAGPRPASEQSVVSLPCRSAGQTQTATACH